MATAKKKSSAKTSAKRTAAKKKTVATKSASKKTTSKTSAKVSTKSNKVKQVSRLELLKRFHIFTAAISIVIAVAAVVLLNSQTVNLTIPFSAKDPLASGTQTVLGAANESVATIEFRYLVAALFVVSAILSLLLATVLRKKYEAGIANATSGIRWIFMGIVSALVLELVSAQAGIQDLVTLKLVAGLVLVTAVLGWLAERDNKNVNSPKWSAYGLSIFTGVLAWLPLVVALLGTYVYGTERFGWHVYMLAVLVLIGFGRIALLQYRHIKYPNVHKKYLVLEEKYLSAELFVKLAFAAVIFIALID